VSSRTRAACAGVAAAVVWAAYEPLGKRLFRTSYGDVAVLEHAIPSRTAALAVHVVNGGLFGIAYDELRRRTGRDGAGFGVAVAIAENTLLWPLVGLLDRENAQSPRAFASATAGHALFGALLGALA
jgi:hypothetical protein